MRETLLLLVIMWIVTICTYISYVPQIVKIIKTKSSEDISIVSWVLWFISSTCDTVYSVVLSRPELIIATLSEFILILITLVLSFVYKHRKTITLGGLELEYKEEYDYYLLQAIVGNYYANKEAIKEIAEKCTSEVVLTNIINNEDIPKEIKEVAKNRIADLKYKEITDISHISGN